jgi:ribulose bisphosphate carboxylase small subunit
MRFETFAFLPPLSQTQTEAQIAHALGSEWVPMIEFTENPNSADFYWRQWPIMPAKINANTGKPEAASATHIANQIESCARRNPFAYIRFSAYSPTTRQTTLSFIAKTPQEGQ